MSHSSFSVEEFAGSGALKEVLDVLTADGWDDVPTLKMMSPQDMDSLKLTQEQMDSLELRTYLHDRNLMQYADSLEESGNRLPELLDLPPSELVSRYGMKRGHVARFVDRSSACGVILPTNLPPGTPVRRRPTDGQSENSSYLSRHSDIAEGLRSPAYIPNGGGQHRKQDSLSSNKNFDLDGNSKGDDGAEQPLQGIVGNGLAPPRCCGLIRSKRVTKDVTPLSILEKIYVQKLTPEYKKGVTPWPENGELKLPPPMRAFELWANRPVLLLCVRRPGCVMCRAEAHRLYARKSIFDLYGLQLVAVLNEHIDHEVRQFWPRYWGGMVVVDRNRDFFKALGGGKLPKDNLCTGFLFNREAHRNWKRAKATGFENNLTGEGMIKGGLYIIGPGKSGVGYQFMERTFGDWAPLEEVLSVCSNLPKASAKTSSLAVHPEEDSTRSRGQEEEEDEEEEKQKTA